VPAVTDSACDCSFFAIARGRVKSSLSEILAAAVARITVAQAPIPKDFRFRCS